MSFIQCDFFSEVLGMSMSMNVIVPQASSSQIGMSGKSRTTYPTLYLLHGLSDDNTIWMRRSSIERYASPLGLAVVMPNVHRSFYSNMKNGYDYWTYISEEVPSIAQSLFPLSHKREDTFVAGLSMGGYGAFKLALRQPEKFAAAASLSGVLDLASDVKNKESWFKRDFDLIFGEKADITGTENDLLSLLDISAKREGLSVPLFQACGTGDFLYDQNLQFRDKAQRLGLDLHYSEEEGAEHEWSYWDREIEKVVSWLPISR